MEPMSVEQAIEAAKGLTFEKVWMAFMETDARIEEMRKEQQREQQEMRREHQKSLQETIQETQKIIQETQRQMEASQQEIKISQRRTDKIVADLSKNLGGLGNSLGRFTESLFTNELWKKFNELGIPVTRQSNHMKFCDDKEVLAEVDLFIENGEYAIPVEIKTDLSISHVDDHLERIEIVREYLNARGDSRKLIGAVAGGTVPVNVLKYAQKKGFYVITQTGDSVAIADMPPGLKVKEW